MITFRCTQPRYAAQPSTQAVTQCSRLPGSVFCFIWSRQDSSLQSLAPKTNALSIRPQDPLVASQAIITYPLPELPPSLSFSNGFFNVFPKHLQNLFKTFPIISWRLVQDFPRVCLWQWQLRGSEPRPYGLAPEASALDHSAKLSIAFSHFC